MNDNPNLTPEINAAIHESELMGGVFIKDLPVGKTLKVRTQNTVYFRVLPTGKSLMKTPPISSLS